MFGQEYDIAIIGGGLNGCAIARDAAGRGLAVFLCEQGDLGGGASSRTARLVHGGLHRLVTLDLRGLREALVEQRILLQAAPHVVSPARFVLPHHERQWPRWALRLGLFAYDHVARRNLPAARRVDFESDPSGIALNANFETGFEYSDCIADDARLVVLNAIDARGRGASINPRMRCVVAERDGRAWRLSLESTETGERSTVRARTLVNATGPSSGAVLDHVIHADQRLRPRLVKESHIIVARHGQSGHGYTLPNADGRIVYALPYERDFMIVGTSSVDFDGDPNGAAIEAREIDYLLDVANQYFYRPIEWHDIVRGFSCVTAIHEAGEARRGVTRDHHIAVEPGMMPLITAYGGSLTTHRRLAAQVVDRIVKFTKAGPAWTHRDATLPGGNFSEGGAVDLARALQAAYPFVEPGHARRLAVTYGTRATSILAGARRGPDLGAFFGADLTEAEVNYLVTEEWARTSEDILWRRTRLGLHFTRADVAALDAWMTAGNVVAAPSAAE